MTVMHNCFGVLTRWKQNGQLRMEENASNCCDMWLYCCQALLCLIIPYFYCFVVRSWGEVWSIAFVKIYSVYWCLVTWEGKIGFTVCCKIPKFYCFVHWGWCEFSEILWVEGEGHYEMFMLIEYSFECKSCLIVPEFYFGIIWAGYD